MQDYGRDPEYADASIDAMREQKLAVNENVCSHKTKYSFYSLGITTLLNNENTFTFLIRIKFEKKRKRKLIILFLKCTHKIN